MKSESKLEISGSQDRYRMNTTISAESECLSAYLYDVRNKGTFEVVIELDVIVDQNVLQQSND